VNDLFSEVASYYNAKIEMFGDTPSGVDWNDKESQFKRFEQLCKIIDSRLSHFTINDLGCGYAALLDYLIGKKYSCTYFGLDVSDKMIDIAKKRHAPTSKVQFVTASVPDRKSDYGVASGIFNVRLGISDTEWFNYLQDLLDALDRTSKLAFSFNCLTCYSDNEKKRDYLYYADPCALFDLCKRRYSRNVALLHDYGLFEFTILVRKTY